MIKWRHEPPFATRRFSGTKLKQSSFLPDNIPLDLITRTTEITLQAVGKKRKFTLHVVSCQWQTEFGRWQLTDWGRELTSLWGPQKSCTGQKEAFPFLNYKKSIRSEAEKEELIDDCNHLWRITSLRWSKRKDFDHKRKLFFSFSFFFFFFFFFVKWKVVECRLSKNPKRDFNACTNALCATWTPQFIKARVKKNQMNLIH